MLYVIKFNHHVQIDKHASHKAYGPYDPMNQLSEDEMKLKIEELEKDDEEATIIVASTTY